MISVTGQAIAVIERGCAEILEHRARRNDSVEAALFYRFLALIGDYGPHLVRVREWFGHILGLAQVEVGLREYVIKLRGASGSLLGCFDFTYKPLYRILLRRGPAPVQLPSCIFSWIVNISHLADAATVARLFPLTSVQLVFPGLLI